MHAQPPWRGRPRGSYRNGSEIKPRMLTELASAAADERTRVVRAPDPPRPMTQR